MNLSLLHSTSSLLETFACKGGIIKEKQRDLM